MLKKDEEPEEEYNKLVDWDDNQVKVEWKFGGRDNVWYDAANFPRDVVGRAKKAAIARRATALKATNKRKAETAAASKKKRKTQTKAASGRKKSAATPKPKPRAATPKSKHSLGSEDANDNSLLELEQSPIATASPTTALKEQLRLSQEQRRDLQRQLGNSRRDQAHDQPAPKLCLEQVAPIAAPAPDSTERADQRHTQMMALMMNAHVQSMDHSRQSMAEGRQQHAQNLAEQRLALQAATERASAGNAQLLLAFLGNKK
jgi:hypothetical protein